MVRRREAVRFFFRERGWGGVHGWERRLREEGKERSRRWMMVVWGFFL